MSRRQHAHAEDFTPAPRPQLVTDDLPLFSVDVPNIQTPAPAAPGSATSEAAAKAVTDPCRAASHAKIMVELYRSDVPLTREELSARTYTKESSLCARLFELRPLWVATHDGAGRSAAGLAVDTYSLTEAGRKRVREWSREFPKPERPQL